MRKIYVGKELCIKTMGETLLTQHNNILMNSLNKLHNQTEELFAQKNRFLLFSAVSLKYNFLTCGLWLLSTMIKGSQIGTIF